MNAIQVGIITIALFVLAWLVQTRAVKRSKSRSQSKGMKRYWKSPKGVVRAAEIRKNKMGKNKKNYYRIYSRGYQAGKRKMGKIKVTEGGKVISYIDRKGMSIWDKS